jgi:hypothetical protein
MSIYSTDFATTTSHQTLDGTQGWYAVDDGGGSTRWQGATGGGAIANKTTSGILIVTTAASQDGVGGDVEASGKVVTLAAVSRVGPAIRVQARAEAGGSVPNCYYAQIDGTNFFVEKLVSGVEDDVGNVVLGVSGGTPNGCILTIQAIGTTIKGKCQRPSDGFFLKADGTWDAPEVWAVTGTDSDISGQGYYGFVGKVSSGAAYDLVVDDFAISAASGQPTLTWAVNSAGTTLTGTPSTTVTLTGDPTDIILHGTSAVVASGVITGGNLVLTLTGHIVSGATVTIDVPADMVEDSGDVPNAVVTTGAVTNNSTQGVPSTPTSLAHGTVTSTAIPLTWDTMTGADAYLVKIAEDSGFTINEVTIDTATAMTTAVALNPNTLYYIKVASYNDAGTSAYCVAITATTLAADLVAPTLTLVSKTATNIIVNVGAASGGTPPYEYSVTVGTSSGDTNVADSNIAAAGRVNIVTDLGIGPLTPETTYYINAWVDDAGAGDRIAGNELVVRTRAISSGRLSIGGSGVSFGRGPNIGSGAGVQF